jgi:hypothetical protein
MDKNSNYLWEFNWKNLTSRLKGNILKENINLWLKVIKSGKIQMEINRKIRIRILHSSKWTSRITLEGGRINLPLCFISLIKVKWKKWSSLKWWSHPFPPLATHICYGTIEPNKLYFFLGLTLLITRGGHLNFRAIARYNFWSKNLS